MENVIMDSVTIIDDARTVVERLAQTEETAPIYYDDQALGQGYCRFIVGAYVRTRYIEQTYGGDWFRIDDDASATMMAHIMARVALIALDNEFADTGDGSNE
jgi:hypothetical protein